LSEKSELCWEIMNLFVVKLYTILIYHSMAGRAGRQDQQAGHSDGWEELQTEGGLGEVPETGNEMFRRVANVDALGTCR
jgi:hypothetical protein